MFQYNPLNLTPDDRERFISEFAESSSRVSYNIELHIHLYLKNQDLLKLLSG